MLKTTTTYILLTILSLLSVSCDHEDGKKFLRDIHLASHPSVLAVGDTITLSLVYEPKSTNSGIPDADVIWSSSDSSTISIHPTGPRNAIITAKAIGKATIRASLGHFFTTAIITVDDYVNPITDKVFLEFCISNFDKNHDGILQGSEVAHIESIDASGLQNFEYITTTVNGKPHIECIEKDISFEGLQLFRSLKAFKACKVRIGYLDLSGNPELTTLNISQSHILSLDISHNSKLAILDCHADSSLYDNLYIGTFDTDGPNALHTINCSRSLITSLDLSRCVRLTYIDCSNNSLTSLNLSNCPEIRQISCYGNNINNITISTQCDTTLLQTLETDPGVTLDTIR